MKTQNQHTPGPWRLCKEFDGSAARWLVTGNDKDFNIAYIHAPESMHAGELAGEYLHNAQLIAAAPDLLARLETMVAVFNVDDIDPLQAFMAIEQARAALAKAKGEHEDQT